MDWNSQTEISKKGHPKFPSAQISVTLGKFYHLESMNILGWQKFGLFHIEIKFVCKYVISSFQLVNSHYIP